MYCLLPSDIDWHPGEPGTLVKVNVPDESWHMNIDAFASV
jgi:hypothetical protein